jgi:predicted lipoprotein with Yx(FWY)xxD motif
MRKLRLSTLGLLLATSIAAGCAGDRMFAVAEPGAGVMTDWYDHRTLYTFAADPTNPPSSACVSAYCEWQWPPFRVLPGERARGDFTIIKRADGTQQWAYKGKPLYFYVGDRSYGAKTGEGLGGGVWQTVKY